MGGARTRNLHRMKVLRYPLRYPGEDRTRASRELTLSEGTERKTSKLSLTCTSQTKLALELLRKLGLEGSCERYARALLPYLGLHG